MQQWILLLVIGTIVVPHFFFSIKNQQTMMQKKESLTISSRHCIVPRDASTISSDRLSTRVWALLLIKDERV